MLPLTEWCYLSWESVLCHLFCLSLKSILMLECTEIGCLPALFCRLPAWKAFNSVSYTQNQSFLQSVTMDQVSGRNGALASLHISMANSLRAEPDPQLHFSNTPWQNSWSHLQPRDIEAIPALLFQHPPRPPCEIRLALSPSAGRQFM